MKDQENHEINLEVNDIGYSKKPICLYNRENKLSHISLNSWNPFLVTGETDSCYQIQLLCGDTYSIQKTSNVRNANEVQEKKIWKPLSIGMKALAKLIEIAESLCTISFLFLSIITPFREKLFEAFTQKDLVNVLLFNILMGTCSMFFRVISPYAQYLRSYLERRADFYPYIKQYEKLDMDNEGQRCPGEKEC